MSSNDRRPTCVYVLPCLKKNSTILVCLMAIGIAMALYGIYAESKMRANPNYKPVLSVGRYLTNSRVGEKIASLNAKTIGKTIESGSKTHKVVSSIPRSVALITGLIHLGQIILLKMYCRSVSTCKIIMGLSIFNLVLSALCITAAMMSCKTICLTCLGLHNIGIIVYSLKRKEILQNSMCPVAGRDNSSSCIPEVSQMSNASAQLRKRVALRN